MEKNKKNSTKCHGAKAPPESCYVKHKNMIVPNGKPVPTGSGSYMGHNEYIVYNTNQARIRYIIEMKMNGWFLYIQFLYFLEQSYFFKQDRVH